MKRDRAVQIRCRACAATLTPPLKRYAGPHGDEDGEDYVPRGTLGLTDGESLGMGIGHFATHLEDAKHLGYVRDGRRLSGCCGPSGTDGPNRICACGAEVATEKADCWMPHAVVFDPEKVELVEVQRDDSNV